MKHYISLIALLMLHCLDALSQETIQGKVRDAETARPVEGVHIRFEGNKNAGSITGSDGQFVLKTPSKEFVLILSHIGYQTDTVRFQKSEPAGETMKISLDIKLKPVFAKMSKEVVITSQRADSKSAMVYTEIGSDELTRNNTGRDIPFLLESVPSINITSDAGNGTGYTGLRIRGSDASRINITIDGIPINDPESHLLYWVNMPDLASSTDQIQVQRGAGTSSNGASSFGGGIHITTSRPSQEPFGQASLGYGSFGTQRASFKAGTGMIQGKWSFEARLSKIKSDGYIDRGSSDLKSFFVSGGYYGEKHSLRMNVFSGKEITYQSWYGVPEAALDTNRTWNQYTYENQVDDYQQDHYQLFHSWKISDNIEWNTALHFTYGRGFYEEFKEGEALSDYLLDDVTIGTDTITETDLIRRKWLDNDFYGVTTNIRYTIKSNLGLVLGGGYNEYDGDHFGEVIWARYASNGNIRHRYYDNNGFKKDLNLFAKSTWDISERISLYSDFQFRTVDYAFKGFDEMQNEVPQNDRLSFVNPKVGITYTKSPGKYGYLSVSVASKEPSRYDYTESSIISRPKAEKLYDLESGYHHIWQKVSAKFNYFLMQYRDQLVLTGQVNDVGNYTRTNVPDSYREGFEAEFSWSVTDKILLKGNGSISRHKIKEFGEYIDDYDLGTQQLTIFNDADIAFSPNITAYANLSYQPIKSIQAELVCRHTGKQYLDNTSNNSKTLDPYTVTDLRLHWSPKSKSVKSLTLSLIVFNILDELYESNGYTFGYIADGARTDENYYYPQAGRNFMLKADVRF
ncbi:MAG: TonB-dependent receptor [Bacteroidota bacterium]